MPSEPATTHRQAELSALSRASGALWLATLSLMTAYMHTAAPAHKYLLASRIARNLCTLRERACFSEVTRATFSKLATRWKKKADALSPTASQRRSMFERWMH